MTTEATADLFTSDHWLRTGDCGVFVDEQLVITGRSKDIIIINGQNYYPHDIEEIVARVDGLDLGKVVVGGIKTEGSQTEELLVFVLFRQELDTFSGLAIQFDQSSANGGTRSRSCNSGHHEFRKQPAVRYNARTYCRRISMENFPTSCSNWLQPRRRLQRR